MLKLFVCVTYLFITSDIVQCKTNIYTFNVDLPGWVAVHMIPATWEEALLTCHYEGATLASPIDENMSKIIYEAMSEISTSHVIFVGTHSLFSDGVYVSVEGVPLGNMPVKYRNINRTNHELGLSLSHNPTDKQEECLTMEAMTQYLYTTSCTERHPYVCYKKMNHEVLNQCGTFDNSYHFNEHTGSCYKLHQDYRTWSRANMICEAEGGYLVILNNEKEAQLVTNMFPNEDRPDSWQLMHIGLRSWSSDRIWLTGHGESLESVYNKWAPNQPDNFMYNQNCGALTRNGILDDASCENRAIFVCEKDPEKFMFQPVGQES